MGLMSVPNTTTGAAGSLGSMLYAGNYTPELHEASKPEYQNFVSLLSPSYFEPQVGESNDSDVIFVTYFTTKKKQTVTVPAGQEAGNTTLNVAHFYVVGAGLAPILEIVNISVMITN